MQTANSVPSTPHSKTQRSMPQHFKQLSHQYTDIDSIYPPYAAKNIKRGSALS